MQIRALQRDGRVLLEVRDNGTGMDAETRDRCFEPFFTTRPREVATGLGLSTGRALLHDFGADVRILDSTDEGSTFEVSLPILDDSAAASTGERARTVYLVMSDPRQRAVVRLLLAQHGLREWSRDTTGDERLEARGAPDVVIGDVDGLDAYARSRAEAGSQTLDGPAPQLIVIGQDGGGGVRRADGAQWIDARRLSTIGELLR
jgi:hypothetical protein